ncbi:MAG TPA: T9SS type A sorting domain-containing protein [candidate division Zixibacteria bacterium]|nr:T9SS type A sorting domain-containing protein [candidate division Zixibacteria bacterium]
MVFLVAASSAQATNTRLTITSNLPDTVCPGVEFTACAQLKEACGGGYYAPLPNRWIYFFLNSGGCGVDVGQVPDDSAKTDANGVACATLMYPAAKGEYALRVKFLGEPKPGPSQPPNSACQPWKKVQLSASNDCHGLVVDPGLCEHAPEASCPGDTTIVLCSPGEVCLPGFNCSDLDGDLMSCSVSLGTLEGGTVCFNALAAGVYEIVLTAVDSLLHSSSCTTLVTVELNSPPVVNLPNDTTVFFCQPVQLCFPVDITDADCDIVSVTTNQGAYSGTEGGFDQIARLNEMGGTVTQIGGGAPGKVLYTAGDFVAPVNTQSGVSVSLPNFGFANYVVDYGSFPNGLQPGNSAVHMLGSPTDLTFTTPGIGGPDGGDGDGSVAFASGNYCVLGLYTPVTTCNGSPTDLYLFTNTDGTGTVQLRFYLGSVLAHTVTRTVTNGAVGSGFGGVTFDLPDGLTFDRVRITCTSGILEIDGFAARTASSPTTTDVCFTAAAAGSYDVIVTATDACGNVGADTMTVAVVVNRPPVANAGSDLTMSLCELSQICFGVSFSDPDNNLVLKEKVSGPGTLAGNQICFTPAAAGGYTFIIRAVDACGLEDRDTVVVTVGVNHRPLAVEPEDIVLFLCDPIQLCYTFTASDPDGNNLTWTKLAGVGTVSPNGQFCFTPTTSGIYAVAAIVRDSCGLADTTSIKYTITLNSAPVAADPGPAVDLFQCNPAQVCYNFAATDVNGGTLLWTKLSGAGTVSSTGQWCFTPTGAGTYAVTAQVADSCGDADTVSHTYNITINRPPTIALGADTALSLCAPQQICLSYTAGDPDAGDILTETMVAGYGAIDTAANRVCFTPTTGGLYQFIVQVTDNCGKVDVDTALVLVSFGEAAAIECPTGPINVSLCSADQVCRLVAVTPSSATVTASFGSWSAGELCFQADTSGTYVIRVIAAESCGADTCTLTFNVVIGAAASITCPEPSAASLCAPDTVCEPVSINGSDLSITVTPIGWYSAGNVCFVADTSGLYALRVIANTPCGADTCSFAVDVTINTPPTAANPTSPVDTFVCASAAVCYQFAATDAEGGSLTWSRLSGSGTVSSSGLWCFTATAGSHSVVAVVADPCGAKDTVSLAYNVTINSAPVMVVGNDTTIFQCAATALCLPYTATDANNNITLIEILAGAPGAVLDQPNSRFCFTPSGAGSYQFILRVTDACGQTDRDTITVTIGVNSPPVVSLGADQTLFGCTPAEICLPVASSDPDNNLASVNLISSPGTLVGNQVCFTPTGTGSYLFIVRATDACGATDYDTAVVNYTLNSPPVVNAGADQTLFLCAPAQICWPASGTDPDGNLSSVTLTEGVGTFSGSQICFTPAGNGSYLFVLKATDACGATDYDSVTIGVTINEAPVCVVPNDTSIAQCVAQEVCLPAHATDANGNLQVCQIVSGPGSLVGGNWCYTPSSDQTVTVVMRCTDSCGAFCESQFTVSFEVNGPPQIAFGADINTFQCTPTAICLPYTASDPEGLATTTIALVSGPGTLDLPNSQVCYTPSAPGTSTFIIRIADHCNRADYDTINVTVGLNVPPAVNAGSDQDLFLCQTGAEICWPASVSDANNNLTTVNLIGPGTFDGDEICFNPTTSGDYDFILEATDACGEYRADTLMITVTNNEPPVVQLPGDSILSLCAPQAICFGYTVSDPNGGRVTEAMLSGFGTIDTAANQICFTPTAAGSYEFIVRATDSCGATDRDTMVVTVAFGNFAAIDCPTGPITVSLCGPDEVCYLLDIAPSGATVQLSNGTYSGGQLCFQADTTGTYQIEVIASTDCSADTCRLTFNVDIGSAAQISCPGPQQFDICAPDTVCVPVTVLMRSDTVTVSPIGWFSGGNVCFVADTSGHYELTVIASTECGADTCMVVADVSINSAPVAEMPDPVDSFLCAPGQICFTFSATDADSDPLTWSRLSGPGTVTAAGVWCFTPTEAGTYTVTVKVTDPCAAADTATMTYSLTFNSPPTVDLGGGKVNKLRLFQCDPNEQCVPYTVTDPDNNVVLEQLVSGAATLDTAANQLCFTAGSSGTYRFIVRVQDACGASDLDTLDVTVQLNNPPVANAGADQQVFLCASAPICWPASCSDPDNNLDSCYLITPAGVYSGGQICFTPDTAGVYRFILRSVDVCGDADQDTAFVTVEINTAPVCHLPNDTTIAQCVPTQVQLPVGATDVDGNLDRCEIITGPGSIQNGKWVYLPTADQIVTVQVLCIDSCGTVCTGDFTVTFQVNEPPLVNLGPDTTLFLCQPQQVCRPVTVTDDENNLQSTTVLSPAGATLNGNQVCFATALGTPTYTVIVEAADACGRSGRDTSIVKVNFNRPPVLTVTPSFTIYLDVSGEVCFSASAADPDNNLASVSITAPATLEGNQACFWADSSGVYCFVVTAHDACNVAAVDTICVTVAIDECIHLRVEKTHNSFQGNHEFVDIFQQGSGKEIGGFDLLLQYDPTALLFNNAVPGDLLEQCGWEYFTYRQGPAGNCSGCPNGLVRIVAIAEYNNGANHPGCFLQDLTGSLATLDFVVSNDRNLECQYAPIRFFWVDCGDNAVSSRTGDTLFISRKVFDFELNEMTSYTGTLPGFTGAPDVCITSGGPGKPSTVRCVDFTNGGVDIVCADSIDARGDINLDGQMNTIADAVLLSNYFVYGLGVFTINVEGQIAATDVNADGLALSVADLVYLIRVVVGDALPYPKLDPNKSAEVQLALIDGVLEIQRTDYEIGAIALILEGEAVPELHPEAKGMELRYSFDGTDTRVLVYNSQAAAALSGGKILRIGGAARIKTIDLGAFNGLALTAKVSSLPSRYALSQNFPNPFNPATTIEFALPKTTDWELKIFNVLGQTVETFTGTQDVGYMKIVWDAGRYASGVYLYRLTAGEFTATKKMVLLK